MKYIDADKLIAEIERFSTTEYGGNTLGDDVANGALNYVLEEIIPALQQEPRFPKYDNIVDKVFGAGNLEGFEYREAEILVALAKEELLKSLQQEQPEANFEKELCEYFEGWRINYYSETEELLKNNGCTVDIDDVKEIARHFYELGLNARKV